MAERTKDVSAGNDVIISEVTDITSVPLLSPKNAILIKKITVLLNANTCYKTLETQHLLRNSNPTKYFAIRKENGRAC